MKIFDKIKAMFSGLPSFAEERDGKIYVDPDKAYPLYLDKIGATGIDQCWLEIARRCFTEDLAKAVNSPVHIVILRKDGKWALKNFPVGLGAEFGAASFRMHYNKLNAS